MSRGGIAGVGRHGLGRITGGASPAMPALRARQTGEREGNGRPLGGRGPRGRRSSSATSRARRPSKLGSMARMRSASGGWVSSRWKNDSPMPLPKNMWLASRRGPPRVSSRAQAANLLERAGQAGRVARELHRRGVGEELALAADGGLDEAAEEDADPANQDQRQAEQGQRILVLTSAAGVAAGSGR